jgi:hypothetical protein
MRFPVAPALAVALAVTGAPASASTHDTVAGGCFLTSLASQASPTAPRGDFAGLYGVTTVTTVKDTGAPVRAAVTCEIHVNGALWNTATWIGDGVQLGQQLASFPASEIDAVELCRSVEYAGGESDPLRCRRVTELLLPPLELIDATDAAAAAYVDPTACPVLQAHAGYYGQFTIGADGDVDTAYLPPGLHPLWDCPPYRVRTSKLRVLVQAPL